MGTIVKKKYDGFDTATITLANLADGAFAVSDEISNTIDLFLHSIAHLKAKSAGSGTVATGIINLYVIQSVDGSDYPDADNYKHHFIGSINMIAVGSTYHGHSKDIAKELGDMPEKFKLVVENQTGGAFSASAGDHSLVYRGTYDEPVTT